MNEINTERLEAKIDAITTRFLKQERWIQRNKESLQLLKNQFIILLKNKQEEAAKKVEEQYANKAKLIATLDLSLVRIGIERQQAEEMLEQLTFERNYN